MEEGHLHDEEGLRDMVESAELLVDLAERLFRHTAPEAAISALALAFAQLCAVTGVPTSNYLGLIADTEKQILAAMVNENNHSN